MCLVMSDSPLIKFSFYCILYMSDHNRYNHLDLTYNMLSKYVSHDPMSDRKTSTHPGTPAFHLLEFSSSTLLFNLRFASLRFIFFALLHPPWLLAHVANHLEKRSSSVKRLRSLLLLIVCSFLVLELIHISAFIASVIISVLLTIVFAILTNG